MGKKTDEREIELVVYWLLISSMCSRGGTVYQVIGEFLPNQTSHIRDFDKVFPFGHFLVLFLI